jgi:hypothetical protein
MPQPGEGSEFASPGFPDTKVITVTTPEGQPFLLEIRDRGGRIKVAGGDTFRSEDLIASIKSISGSIVAALQAISPDKFSVEFGVEAAFESGKLLALLCSGSAKANLKITLEWQKVNK